MSPMKPKFSQKAVADRIDQFVEDKQKQAFETLAYIGETIVNRARDMAPFEDQTGNLRSSIGYVVIVNGDLKKLEVTKAKKDERGAGVKRGKDLAKEFGERFSKGIVLVVFAGMEYAAAVESRGYDVITGSVETQSALYAMLKEELGLS